MKKITTSLKFPFVFSKDRLSKDLNIISEEKWIPHFNEGGYNGNWNVIPLYAPEGEESNILALQTENKEIKETDRLKKCSYLKEVIDSFKCPVITARLLNLSVGSEIKTHTDYNSGYEDNFFRVHVPIATNDAVEFILDGERIVMDAGDCWYTNVNYPHSVANNGTTDRIHLVIDFERNSWSDELFFSLAPKESFEVEISENHSPETMIQMIEALELMDTPTSVQMVQDLKSQLKALDKNASE